MDERAVMNTHPAPSEIADARLRAGLSQAAAASLVHLGSKSRWYEYERGSRPIDPARWELFLLKTGQHPDWQAAPMTISWPLNCWVRYWKSTS